MVISTALVIFVIAVRGAHRLGKVQGAHKRHMECDEEYGLKMIQLEGMSHRERERFFDRWFSRNGIMRKNRPLDKEKEFMRKWLLKSEIIEKK